MTAPGLAFKSLDLEQARGICHYLMNSHTLFCPAAIKDVVAAFTISENLEKMNKARAEG
jgi:hypothetical protein